MPEIIAIQSNRDSCAQIAVIYKAIVMKIASEATDAKSIKLVQKDLDI